MADLYSLSLTIDPSGMVTGSAKAASALKDVGEAAERSEKKVHDSSEHMKESFDRVSEGLLKMAEIVGVTLGLMKFAEAANEARELAEEYERTGAMAQQMGVTFGYTREQIIEAEKAMISQSATMREARQSSLLLMNAHIDLAKAGELMATAQNLAAKENISAGAAMESLILAVQTGMARQLRHAGVVADFTKATQAMARELGVSVDQLSEQQIEQARLTEVMRAAAGIQGVYGAALQTTGQQMKEAGKAVDDLKIMFGTLFAEMTKGAMEETSHQLQEMAKWAKENPDKLDDIRRLLVSIGEAVAIVAGLWLLWEARAAAAAAKTAILASVETVMTIVQLATAIESAADAMALLELAAEAVNPLAIAASVAALAAGLFAYKKMTEDSRHSTEELRESLQGLGKEIKTTGGAVTAPNAGLVSSNEAIKRLQDLRAQLPALESGLRAVGDAYAQQGTLAGQLAEQEALLSAEIAKGSVGLVGRDKEEMAALLTRKAVAMQYADLGKKTNEARVAGEDAVRSATQEALSYHLVGDALERSRILFEYNTAVIKANRDMLSTARDTALDYAAKVRDAQLNALTQKEATGPIQAFISSSEEAWGQMWSSMVTRGVDGFRDLADQIRNVFAQLLGDLAKMAFEKKLMPKLANFLGLSTDAAGAAGVAALMGTMPHTDPRNSVSIGGITAPMPVTATLPTTTVTAQQGGGIGTYAAAGGIGLAGLTTAYGLGRSGGATVGALGGAASGALAGAAIGSMVPVIGTAVGAVVGGVVGLATGLLGAKAKHDEMIHDWEHSRDDFVNSLKAFPSSAAQQFAQIEKTFQDLVDAGKKIGAGVDPAAVQAKNDAQQRIRQEFTDGITTQLNALGGPAGEYANQLAAIEKAYRDNVATAKAIGGTEDDLNAVEKLRIKQLQALKDATDAANKRDLDNLTLRQLHARGLTDEARKLQDLMELEDAQRARKSAQYMQMLQETQAIEAQAEAQAKATQAVKDAADAAEAFRQRTASLVSQFLRLTGQTDAADNLDLAEQQRQAMKGATDAGASPEEIAMLQMVQLFQRGQLVAQQHANAQEKILGDQLNNQKQLLEAAKTQLQLTQQVLTTLKPFQQSLLVNAQTTPLSPLAQLNEARKQMMDTFQAAMGGDKNAASKLPGIAGTFLQASRGYNASGPGYVSDFDDVQNILTQLVSKYSDQETVEQQQLDTLQKQVELLEQQLVALRDSKSIAEATKQAVIAELRASRDAALEPNGKLIDQLNALRDTLTGVGHEVVSAERDVLVGNQNALNAVTNAEIAAINSGASAQTVAAYEQVRQLQLTKTATDDGFARQIMELGKQLGFDSPIVQKLIEDQKKYDNGVNAQISAIMQSAGIIVDGVGGAVERGMMRIQPIDRPTVPTNPTAPGRGTLPSLPGFAAGGSFGGGARIVGERGPELELTGPARYLSNNDLAKVLGQNASSNQESLAELKAQTTELRATVRVLQAIGQQQREKLDQLVDATETQTKQQRLQASGNRARAEQGVA